MLLITYRKEWCIRKCGKENSSFERPILLITSLSKNSFDYVLDITDHPEEEIDSLQSTNSIMGGADGEHPRI